MITVSILVFGAGLVLGAVWRHWRLFPFSQLSRWRRSWLLADVARNNGCAILKTRRFIAAMDPEVHDTELDSTYRYERQTIDLHKTALVLIDVWQSHPNSGWSQRAAAHRKSNILPLLDLARSQKLMILHAPHGQEIAADARPLPGEVNLDEAGLASPEALHRFLQRQGIDTLLYAGYASNWCVMHRPVGIIRMRQLGYEIILVRDCTIAFEMPETLDGEWANKVTINTVEHQWGMTSTLSDLQEAFSGN